jgi:hypothetical protein
MTTKEHIEAVRTTLKSTGVVADENACRRVWNYVLETAAQELEADVAVTSCEMRCATLVRGFKVTS